MLSVVVRRKVGQVGQGAETSETTTNASTNASTNDRRVRVLKGKLLLVDLAGSERVGKSGAEGQTFDEAIAINLHLHALGKCIAALASNAETTSSAGSPSQNGASTHHHIPYRESKLTRLLKDSLGGTAMTSLIVTASPGAEHLSETVAALNFGQRALKVTNSLVVKQEVDYRLSARRLQEEVDALTARLERCEVELAAKTALAKRRDAHVRVDDRDEPEPPPDASDAGGIDPATSGFDPVVRLSVNVDPIAALDLVGREELECVEKELAACKQKLAQREDELVQLCVAKEASDEKCDALRLELDSEAQNSLLRSRAVEAKYHAERAELERRWEEDESDRLGREDTWRRELETARNERDELVDAALAERTRWDAEMAAERTKHVAERAEWESERAALVSAAEAAASASEAASARAADALARVASKNAWETERANLIAELDADRAAYAAAHTAEVAELRRAHTDEVHNLRDALECAERALEASDSRRAEEVDALRAEFDDRLRETIATKDSERSALAASAEDEKARLRASLADVVAQSEHAVNDAVQSAYATWRVEELEPAVAAHKADARKLERELADAESRCSTLSDRCSTDSEARERWCIEVAVLRAKWQTERDARVAEQSSHRRAWAEEQRRLQRRFDDEITVRFFFLLVWAISMMTSCFICSQALNDELRVRLGYTDAEAAVGLAAYSVGKPLRFKRAPFPVTAEAAQSATAKRDAVASLFDGQTLPRIVSMMHQSADDDASAGESSSSEDVRAHACKIVANLAAIDERNAVRVVQEGGLRAILRIFGGFAAGTNSESTCRVATGALANVAMAEANQPQILQGGAVELLAMFARACVDPTSARMVAGCVANLCGFDRTERSLHECGGLALVLRVAERWVPTSQEVRTQVARALANYTKCDGGKMRVATHPGALALAFRLASDENDSIARRHARSALCEVATDLDVGAGAVRDVPGAVALLRHLAGGDEGGGSEEGERERRVARKALRRMEKSLPPDHRYSDRL